MLNNNETKIGIINLIGLFGGAIIGVFALYSLVLVRAIVTRDASPEVMVNGSGFALVSGAPIGGVLGVIISNILFKFGVKIKYIAISFGIFSMVIIFYVNHLYDKIKISMQQLMTV